MFFEGEINGKDKKEKELFEEEVNNGKKEEVLEERKELFIQEDSNERGEFMEINEEEFEQEKEEETYRNINITIEIPDEIIYSLVISASKGMAQTEEATCSNVLENKQSEVLEKAYSFIEENKETEIELQEVIQNFFLNFIEVEEVVSECNILAIPALIEKIFSEDGLVEIFQTFIDNIHEVFLYGQTMKENINNKDYNTSAEAFGHILSIGLDFQVNL